jgi:four helix bundle protein
MTEIKNTKKYDLEARTEKFAKDCRKFVAMFPRTTGNFEDGKQLVRSSGSVAANYIEANESISKKDFTHRIKICRKEAKESRLWLNLCESALEMQQEQVRLIDEASQLTRIFGSILEKTE